MRLNLSTRMLSIFISVIVVVMGLAVMAMTYFPISREFNQQSQAELTRNIHLIQGRLDQMCGEYLKIGGMLAQREDLITALSKSDSPRLQQLTRETLAATGVQSLAVIDQKGVVFTPGRVEKADAGLLKLAAVKMALAGTSATGCVSVDGDANVELQAACPVKRGNQVAGCILARHNLTENHWFVDEIKADFSNECTIFAGATRNTTTLVKDGQRIVGTKMDNPEVIATVIEKGGRFLKRNTIMGRSYDTAYWPLLDPERKPAGMLFIGRDLASTNRATQQIFRGVLLSAFLIGGLMVGLGWLMMRALNRQIRSVSDAVGDGASLVQAISHEAAATNQNLAAGAGEQASSLEEASAALEQMTATTQQNAERAGTARQLAEATQGAADHGSEAMRQMEDTIVRIRNASQETAKVIRTIDEIAFQTNLLALNAAVEAARAGEAGKGFAVVAEEVRNLAQRSAVAAKNTEQLLSDAQQQSENGVLVSAEVSRIFRQIVDEIKKLSTLIAEVATASHEQAQGINQISTAIIRVDQVTQTNAAHAAEAAASNEKLSTQAQELGRLANSLVAIVSGCQG